MGSNSQDVSYLFKPVQFLGKPKIFPPPAEGKLPISVQFIIPELKLGNHNKKFVTQLARTASADLWAVHTQRVQNKRTKKDATLVTFAFYIPSLTIEEEYPQSIVFTSVLLVLRFLGLLSFFVGSKLSAVHLQSTILENDHYSRLLPMAGRGDMPPTKVELPTDLEGIMPPDNVFSALFWLRRGLAERDPIETFSALMVCLQIMARHIVVGQPVVRHCPSCGAQLEVTETSITSLTRELIVSRLGASGELFERLWRARNAIVAHGNLPVTPQVLLDLTELKFDAAILAFQSIKLGLGMPLDLPPSPSQAFFVTDAFMYVD